MAILIKFTCQTNDTLKHPHTTEIQFIPKYEYFFFFTLFSTLYNQISFQKSTIFHFIFHSIFLNLKNI